MAPCQVLPAPPGFLVLRLRLPAQSDSSTRACSRWAGGQTRQPAAIIRPTPPPRQPTWDAIQLRVGLGDEPERHPDAQVSVLHPHGLVAKGIAGRPLEQAGPGEGAVHAAGGIAVAPLALPNVGLAAAVVGLGAAGLGGRAGSQRQWQRGTCAWNSGNT